MSRTNFWARVANGESTLWCNISHFTSAYFLAIKVIAYLNSFQSPLRSSPKHLLLSLQCRSQFIPYGDLRGLGLHYQLCPSLEVEKLRTSSIEINALPLPPPLRIVRSIEDGSISCQVLKKVLVDGTERSRRNGILGCKLDHQLTFSVQTMSMRRIDRMGDLPDDIDQFTQCLRWDDLSILDM